VLQCLVFTSSSPTVIALWLRERGFSRSGQREREREHVCVLSEPLFSLLLRLQRRPQLRHCTETRVATFETTDCWRLPNLQHLFFAFYRKENRHFFFSFFSLPFLWFCQNSQRWNFFFFAIEAPSKLACPGPSILSLV